MAYPQFRNSPVFVSEDRLHHIANALWVLSSFLTMRGNSAVTRLAQGWMLARNTFSGTFTGVFTQSPAGPLNPTGQHVEWEVINTFRYDDDGQLAEE